MIFQFFDGEGLKTKILVNLIMFVEKDKPLEMRQSFNDECTEIYIIKQDIRI